MISESLLGLDSRLLKHIHPLPFPETANYDSTVTINWGSGVGFTGGFIDYSGANCVDKNGDAVEGITRMVITSIYTNPLYGKDHKEIHYPKQSLICVLTMIATLNRAALVGGEELLHVVRANDKSAPYFERFVGAEVYSYCNLQGKYVTVPITVSPENWVLYACKYPVIGLAEILDEYAIDDAS